MIDLKKNEEYILEYWQKNNINNKIKKQSQKNKRKFYFLDGPPYASGTMGSHHMWVGATKDIVLRFKRYMNYNVHDRAGFDVHGLPIEHKVEKELKLESKAEIETKIGIDNFVEECKKYAKLHVKSGIEIFKRFGVSLDFESIYLAYKPEYIERSWGIFKKIVEANLLYKDFSSLAYCIHCGTVLSAQGSEVEYEDETDPSIFVKFKIKNTNLKIDKKQNIYLVIWTTTPWTLVANMAIAVKTSAEYIIINSENENYIIAKKRLEEFKKLTKKNTEIKMHFFGSELNKTTYLNPLGDIDEIKNKFYKVIADENFVDLEEGTGLVHVAPGHGPEDYKLAKKYKIPIFSPVDEHGNYTLKNYSEIKVPKEANNVILAELKQKNALLFNGNILHSYPHCWRCNSKLIFRVTEQWFINVQKLKSKMIKANKKIEWIPDVAKNWFEDTIRNSPNWCISRQRYWGIPLPIWKCESCNQIKVIGTKQEMIENAIEKIEISDLHRPYIDVIKMKCEKCNSTMNRVKDVFDVWYDSGIAHTASLNNEEFEKYFPADWISEGTDQIRGWFSSLLRTSIALYNKAPFKKVSIGGMVKDEIGREMHRHLGNTITIDELLSFVSVDGFRLWCLSHPRWVELKLNKQELNDADKEIIILYNISNLVKEFNLILDKNQINKNIKIKVPSMKNIRKEDEWILSKLNSLILKTTENMNKYTIHEAVRGLQDFMIDDFSRFYLKFAKQRASESKNEIKIIFNICSYVLYNILIISSIAIPFSCEFIYKDLFNEKESIFMNKWPKHNKKIINKRLEHEFDLLKEVSKTILSLREKEHIKLKWPLQEVIIKLNNDEIIENMYRISDLISSYSNIKSLKIIKSETNKKVIKPIFNKLGPEFKQMAQMIANEIIKQNADDIEIAMEKNNYYPLHTEKGIFNIKPNQIVIIEQPILDDTQSFKYGTIEINKEISNELKYEILIRELIHSIQTTRKEMNLVRLNKIAIHMKTEKDLELEIKKSFNNILNKTNAKTIDFEFIENNVIEKRELKILGYNITIEIEKIK